MIDNVTRRRFVSSFRQLLAIHSGQWFSRDRELFPTYLEENAQEAEICIFWFIAEIWLRLSLFNDLGKSDVGAETYQCPSFICLMAIC